MLPSPSRKYVPAIAAALVLLSAAAAEAATEALPEMAQGDPEIVYKQEVVSRAFFQQPVFIGCGNGVLSCFKMPYTVPKKSRLELSHVSCNFTVRSPGYVEGAFAGFIVKNKALFDYQVPVKAGDDGSFQDFSLNGDVRVAGPAGAKLVVAVNANNDVSNVNCLVTGELVKLK